MGCAEKKDRPFDRMAGKKRGCAGGKGPTFRKGICMKQEWLGHLLGMDPFPMMDFDNGKFPYFEAAVDLFHDENLEVRAHDFSASIPKEKREAHDTGIPTLNGIRNALKWIANIPMRYPGLRQKWATGYDLKHRVENMMRIFDLLDPGGRCYTWEWEFIFAARACGIPEKWNGTVGRFCYKVIDVGDTYNRAYQVEMGSRYAGNPTQNPGGEWSGAYLPFHLRSLPANRRGWTAINSLHPADVRRWEEFEK